MRFLVKKFNALRKKLCEKKLCERKVQFNSILTKNLIFDKKVVKFIFYKAPFIFYTYRSHRTQNALFKFLM